MMNVSKYRYSALVLTVLFCLFTVGLPIVIAACPMMVERSGSTVCCPSEASSGASSLKVQKDVSCCKTVIAAERNTTSFLQVTEGAATHSQPLLLILPIAHQALAAAFFTAAQRTQFDGTPPQERDILLVTSTLLI